MADDIASHVLARALQRYIKLTAEIPEGEWTQDVETLHYNRQRRLLSFVENLAKDLVNERPVDDDQELKDLEEVEDMDELDRYARKIKWLEDHSDHDPRGGQEDKFLYLKKREEALFELLSRKNVLQLRRVQDHSDLDPIDPREAGGPFDNGSSGGG